MKAKGLNLGSRRDFRTIYITRLERIRREGSQFFTWVAPVTAAGEISEIHLPQQFPESRKYQPLDWLEIVNNDAVDLTLILNGQGGDYLNVPAATTRSVIGKSIWWVGVRNDDALNNSVLGAIVVTVRRQPMTADMAARGM